MHRRFRWNRRSRREKRSSRGQGRGSPISARSVPQSFRIQECEGRLEELRALRKAQQVKPSPPVETSGEVARLQQMVVDLQCQSRRSEPHSERGGVRARDRPGVLGVDGRQTGVNAALMSGNPTEASRVSGVITDATKSLQPVTMQLSMITNMVTS